MLASLALGMFLGALVWWLVPRLDWAIYEWRTRRRLRGGGEEGENQKIDTTSETL